MTNEPQLLHSRTPDDATADGQDNGCFGCGPSGVRHRINAPQEGAAHTDAVAGQELSAVEPVRSFFARLSHQDADEYDEEQSRLFRRLRIPHDAIDRTDPPGKSYHRRGQKLENTCRQCSGGNLRTRCDRWDGALWLHGRRLDPRQEPPQTSSMDLCGSRTCWRAYATTFCAIFDEPDYHLRWRSTVIF